MQLLLLRQLLFEQNPSRQNFEQEEMRVHLVNCFNKNEISVFHASDHDYKCNYTSSFNQ